MVQFAHDKDLLRFTLAPLREVENETGPGERIPIIKRHPDKDGDRVVICDQNFRLEGRASARLTQFIEQGRVASNVDPFHIAPDKTIALELPAADTDHAQKSIVGRDNPVHRKGHDAKHIGIHHPRHSEIGLGLGRQIGCFDGQLRMRLLFAL